MSAETPAQHSAITEVVYRRFVSLAVSFVAESLETTVDNDVDTAPRSRRSRWIKSIASCRASERQPRDWSASVNISTV
jgi:protoheme ferro-lyase